MNTYLLPRKRGRYMLFSTEFQEPGGAPVEAGQAPGGQKTLWRRLKSGYSVLTEKRRRSEAILTNAAKSARITLHYPEHLSAGEANGIFDDLLAAQIKKHKRWLIVNGALLPLSVLFSIVPGPNLLLAYLAWRTLAHYRGKKGGEKALSELEIVLAPQNQLYRLDKLINKRISLNRKGKIRRIGESLGIERLDKLY